MSDAVLDILLLSSGFVMESGSASQDYIGGKLKRETSIIWVKRVF